MAEIPKKISELPQIRNISTDDLLLVSDYDNGKCLSRKMTMQQLAEFISQKILQSPALTSLIQQKAAAAATSTAQSVATNIANNVATDIATSIATDVAASEAQTAATAAVDDIVKNEIREKTMQVIEENPEDIFDMIDNIRDQQMYINAGGA